MNEVAGLSDQGKGCRSLDHNDVQRTLMGQDKVFGRSGYFSFDFRVCVSPRTRVCTVSRVRVVLVDGFDVKSKDGELWVYFVSIVICFRASCVLCYGAFCGCRV